MRWNGERGIGDGDWGNRIGWQRMAPWTRDLVAHLVFCRSVQTSSMRNANSRMIVPNQKGKTLTSCLFSQNPGTLA